MIIWLGLIYFFIVMGANIIGAISGMGGGVIIKPVLDAIGASTLLAINFYSSFAVFIMSIVSTYKQVKNGIEIAWNEVLRLAVGSMIGGYFGNYLLIWLTRFFNNDHSVNLIQIVLLIITLIIALVFTRPLHFEFSQFQKGLLLFISGIALGLLATLLGIGGGPINVALLIAIFSFTPKVATTYSIVTIFFSQSSKLISSIPMLNTLHLSSVILIFIFFAAVIGGYLGAELSRHISSERVLLLYRITVSGVLLLNVINGVSLIW